MRNDRDRRAELLVVLGGDRASEALVRIRDGHRVTQAASARLIVVSASEPGEAEQLRAIPGVTAVTTGELPPADLAELDESEALFARGWAARPGLSAAKRRRDGLAWDAPGAEPPDLPRAGPARVPSAKENGR